MSKKFTEEQYQKIVKVQEKEFSASILAGSIKKNFWSALDSELTDFINDFRLYDETAAIANPLTREWAHDKFVEKEKKYYWTGREQTNSGYFARLYKDGNEMISSYPFVKSNHNINLDEQLTESEIKVWGFNPEMFDREEV